MRSSRSLPGVDCSLVSLLRFLLFFSFLFHSKTYWFNIIICGQNIKRKPVENNTYFSPHPFLICGKYVLCIDMYLSNGFDCENFFPSKANLSRRIPIIIDFKIKYILIFLKLYNLYFNWSRCSIGCRKRYIWCQVALQFSGLNWGYYASSFGLNSVRKRSRSAFRCHPLRLFWV